jgi:hypothetical protein
MGTNLDVERRLNETLRRFDELSAASSRLSDMILQLDRLRKMATDVGLPTDSGYDSTSPADRGS